MTYILSDGRELMAKYDDLKRFFDKNNIVGRIIKDIRPAALDYLINNLDEIENIINIKNMCAINTDSQVCFLFEDGDNLEIEISGDGPVILGFNTANFDIYPEYDGTCYRLSSLFKHCIGEAIVGIGFEKTDHRMLFPSYMGIDMSSDDDGITEIRFYLTSKKYIKASGFIDFFEFECCDLDGRVDEVPFRELFCDMNTETLVEIFGDEGKYYGTL